LDFQGFGYFIETYIRRYWYWRHEENV